MLSALLVPHAWCMRLQSSAWFLMGPDGSSNAIAYNKDDLCYQPCQYSSPYLRCVCSHPLSTRRHNCRLPFNRVYPNPTQCALSALSTLQLCMQHSLGAHPQPSALYLKAQLLVLIELEPPPPQPCQRCQPCWDCIPGAHVHSPLLGTGRRQMRCPPCCSPHLHESDRGDRRCIKHMLVTHSIARALASVLWGSTS